MTVYRTRKELSGGLVSLRGSGRSIGLVPTMGALHEGHISLVKRSKVENTATVVSVFVNPTQFNDPSDLAGYPRNPGRDLELLRDHGADVIFMPSVDEMYPEPDLRIFDLGGLDRVMEGASREGHFNGVAQIVSKLFDIVRPERAYFGQKDFQQLVIVKHLVGLLDMDLEIVPCPIVREADGLAMSSRNVRLKGRDRERAPFIYQTLRQAVTLKRELSPAELKSWVEEQFDKQENMRLDYFEIVEDKALKPVTSWDEKVNKVGCIAVILGGVRLIDNMFFD
jgi:pantoate--beta-alanine ligase